MTNCQIPLQGTANMSFFQEPDWGDCCEKILLPPTHPNAEVIEIPGYKLVYCNGACPRNYRVYKGESMLGLIFQHIAHWSSGIDEIRYAQPLNAVIALDDFLLAASMANKTDENIAA
ncbi:hypothetical protein IQ244_29880 [Nostoc sp. LEGE 06077]|uniref:hypothetical protein n=1 Tax=Nostoc sp. LEGE 06077 TaxID=915325 RepID=UPI001882CEA5|nr:hypothetical protein [Nostoc sp. LEGE 06077]MBE9210639.1 hypothetical protein [Nostoc sp. LEGE 06077]